MAAEAEALPAARGSDPVTRPACHRRPLFLAVRPVALHAPATPGHQGEESRAGGPKEGMTHDAPATILLAEDDATTRTYLADELTADGFELVTCETAAEALRLAATKFPDLVILDVGLPDAPGLEVLRRVRAA